MEANLTLLSFHLRLGFKTFLYHSGAAIKMTLICNDGHTEEWNSSQSIKTGRLTVPLINLALLCYAFFSGLHWDQLKVLILLKINYNLKLHQAFLDKVGVLCISKATFYRYLHKLVYPCTYEFWLRNQATVINNVLV